MDSEILAKGPHDEGLFNPSYVPVFTNPEEFADAKVLMLQEDFRITLDEEDIAHLKTLKTETQINAAVRTLINKYWR